ncbi:twin-arginine translocation signal domain-containing protein [Haladaptatus sp. NG-SE-30]
MTGNEPDEIDDTTLSRRTLLGATIGTGVAGLSGCVTLSPTVSVSGLAGSEVFERVSVSEPWASDRVAASVSLTPEATTKLGVRGLTVVHSDGSKFDTASILSGQTKKTLFLPVGKSTLTAIDFDEKTVGSVEVTVRGKKVI